MKDDTVWLILTITLCLILVYFIRDTLTPMFLTIDRPYP